MKLLQIHVEMEILQEQKNAMTEIMITMMAAHPRVKLRYVETTSRKVLSNVTMEEQ